jgi:predicted AAA+ superfamily ATPase
MKLKKGKKIYFYDTGIRNAVIKNFNPLSMRQDTGALWEDFLVAERMKFNHYNTRYVNHFFLRTHAQQEIDYIEEFNGALHAFEFKWRPHKKRRIPDSFLAAYPGSEGMVVTLENFEQFIT